ADTRRSTRRRHSEMTADERDDGAEERRFEEAAQEVLHRDGAERAPQEEPRGDVELIVSDEHGARETEHQSERRENRHHHERRDEARQDELLERTGAEGPPRVELLGHRHRAELRRHARADATSDDDRSERRRELPGEREPDDAARVLHAAEFTEPE